MRCEHETPAFGCEDCKIRIETEFKRDKKQKDKEQSKKRAKQRELLRELKDSEKPKDCFHRPARLGCATCAWKATGAERFRVEALKRAGYK